MVPLPPLSYPFPRSHLDPERASLISSALSCPPSEWGLRVLVFTSGSQTLVCSGTRITQRACKSSDFWASRLEHPETWGGAGHCASLTSSQVLLLLPSPVQSFETHLSMYLVLYGLSMSPRRRPLVPYCNEIFVCIYLVWHTHLCNKFILW